MEKQERSPPGRIRKQKISVPKSGTKRKGEKNEKNEERKKAMECRVRLSAKCKKFIEHPFFM